MKKEKLIDVDGVDIIGRDSKGMYIYDYLTNDKKPISANEVYRWIKDKIIYYKDISFNIKYIDGFEKYQDSKFSYEVNNVIIPKLKDLENLILSTKSIGEFNVNTSNFKDGYKLYNHKACEVCNDDELIFLFEYEKGGLSYYKCYGCGERYVENEKADDISKRFLRLTEVEGIEVSV